MPAEVNLPWKILEGRPRVILDSNYAVIGMMDTPALAQQAVSCANTFVAISEVSKGSLYRLVTWIRSAQRFIDIVMSIREQMPLDLIEFGRGLRRDNPLRLGDDVEAQKLEVLDKVLDIVKSYRTAQLTDSHCSHAYFADLRRGLFDHILDAVPEEMSSAHRSEAPNQG